ncbi:hypothetical protein BGZ54_004504 [Gamsiella multidivaricata]|nr:hypothetical protein BGZ54_004504 [Gamsiella multidivaricata]
MAAIHSPTCPQNPPQTFLDKRTPLLPRQSTSDVLSFTHIIADRLAPGQNVWDFFSPPPPPPLAAGVEEQKCKLRHEATDEVCSTSKAAFDGLPPLSPTSPTTRCPGSLQQPQPQQQKQQRLSMTAMISPTSPLSPSFGMFNTPDMANSSKRSSWGGYSNSKRQSLPADVMLPQQGNTNRPNSSSNNDRIKAWSVDFSSSSSTLITSSPTNIMTTNNSGNAPIFGVELTRSLSTSSATVGVGAKAGGNNGGGGEGVVEGKTPKLHKRRSFAQSLRNSVLSLTQLLSPTSSSSSSRTQSPAPSSAAAATMAITVTATGIPHFNVLVLGSDSSPLASTLYKMSSLLPGTSKIRHYQEISGFFVAHFRANDGVICEGKPSENKQKQQQQSEQKDEKEEEEEVKSPRSSTLESEDGEGCNDRASEETLLQLRQSFTQETLTESTCGRSSSDNSTVNSVKELQQEEVLADDEKSTGKTGDIQTQGDTAVTVPAPVPSDPKPVDSTTAAPSPTSASSSSSSLNDNHEGSSQNRSAEASLSIHAFSLDTTWPVPRILAQTFWFPYAHGIIYIVDASRKNDPRGIDHILNARQFLASLVADPHFCRKDIPVVVFANKAGTDPETCYRLDEIIEILGG